MIENEFQQCIFYPNLKIKPPANIPKFYKQLIEAWSKCVQEPITPLGVLSQHIWYNQFIEIEETPVKKIFPFQLFITDISKNDILLNWMKIWFTQ